MTSPCHNNTEDPHDKFIQHLKSGGRLLRVDKLNNTIEIFHNGDFENLSDLHKYGFNDLLIIEDDTIKTSDVLMLLLGVKEERIFHMQEILDAICIKYKDELKQLTYIEEDEQNCINVDTEEGHSWQFIVQYGNVECETVKLDATMILDDENFILTVYPKTILIGPYKNLEIAEGVDAAAQQELMDQGAMAWAVELHEIKRK